MNKKELVAELAIRLACSGKLASEIFEQVLSISEEALRNDGALNIKWFGKFQIVDRKEKVWFDLHTKKPITIPAHKAVRFTPGASLKRKFK